MHLFLDFFIFLGGWIFGVGWTLYRLAVEDSRDCDCPSTYKDGTVIAPTGMVVPGYRKVEPEPKDSIGE